MCDLGLFSSQIQSHIVIAVLELLRKRLVWWKDIATYGSSPKLSVAVVHYNCCKAWLDSFQVIIASTCVVTNTGVYKSMM